MSNKRERSIEHHISIYSVLTHTLDGPILIVGLFRLFVGPTMVYLLDFFCSGIQFYLLLSPYLCFISLLYLDLYALGENALISKGSFMQTEHLCVLIHI